MATVYHPTIPGYAPLYIQTATDSSAVDILITYGVVVKNHSFPITRKPKEPYKNTWFDEHGDDEYIGDKMYVEAFTFTEKCVMITKENDSASARQKLANQIRTFQDYLFNGEFMIFDDYTKTGFRKVRVSDFPTPSNEDYDVCNGKARVIFDVTFKVNDPETLMKMSAGKIVEA